ncbi:RNA polymerase-like protein [Synechococcus phage S-CBS2]|uniref:RNA polymerase-like protein n=1 Tax=Synechococcus phage S-CBS2 TaxID=753084 RepID=UPI00020783FB|nr:RNA polymerase-like protein [Synechococcus phage S-CBS2]ADF42390.1 RNA polymerase-like protein [Synechococcus phage S-CBS2]
MDIVAELSYDGKQPLGPCSAWPRDRHEKLMAGLPSVVNADGTVDTFMPELASGGRVTHAKKVNAGIGKMARGLVRNAGQAIMHGKVSEEIRNERYDTCKACPFFVEGSKRCSECGCFMEAKTWIGGDPNALCPKQKWSR